MSNVIDLGSTPVGSPSPFPQDSPLYFTAVERDLYWHTEVAEYTPPYMPVDTHKMLLRAENGTPVQLAVVGKDYKVVQNKDLFQAIEGQFIESFTPDELNGVLVGDSMSYQGRVCMREYRFPNVRCVNNPGTSVIAFRSIVKNGFGGPSITLYNGAIDFFCTNGMISGRYDCVYAKHTKGLHIPDITRRVRKAIDVFYSNAATWMQWYGKHITGVEARTFFEDMYSDRLANKLYRQFMIERHVHGANMWALYSALTYYATHDEGDFATRNTGVDHSAVTLLKREEQVQSTVASDEWTRLLAA